jgi:DNA-binding response OmpR family regulator
VREKLLELQLTAQRIQLQIKQQKELEAIAISNNHGFLQIGKIILELNTRRLSYYSDIDEITFITNLTRIEFEYLLLLMKQPGKLFTYDYLLEKVWKDEEGIYRRSLDVYTHKLRKYLKADPNLQILSLHKEGVQLGVSAIV